MCRGVGRKPYWQHSVACAIFSMPMPIDPRHDTLAQALGEAGAEQMLRETLKLQAHERIRPEELRRLNVDTQCRPSDSLSNRCAFVSS